MTLASASTATDAAIAALGTALGAAVAADDADTFALYVYENMPARFINVSRIRVHFQDVTGTPAVGVSDAVDDLVDAIAALDAAATGDSLNVLDESILCGLANEIPSDWQVWLSIPNASNTDTQLTTVQASLAFVAVSAVTDTNAAANEITEDTAEGAAVGITAHASDDYGNTISYIMIDDADGRFAVHSTSGVVTLADDSDITEDDVYTITVRATRVTDGVYKEADFAITVVAPAALFVWQGYNYQTALGTDDVGYTWTSATNQAGDVYASYRNNAAIAALAGFTVGSQLPYDEISTGDAIQVRSVGFVAANYLLPTDGVKNVAGVSTPKITLSENFPGAYPASAGRGGEGIYCVSVP